MDPDQSSTRRDRLFGQNSFWIDGHGRVVALGAMSRAHLQAVVAMLRRDAEEWHRDEGDVTSAVLDQVTEGGEPDDDQPDEGQAELWADAVAAANAADWLADTVLMRAILARLDEMRTLDPAGLHECLCEPRGVPMQIVEVYEVEDPAVTHVVWACPSCGARARQDRPREGVDVEQFLGPGAHSWPS